jgi:hypothetical protein
MSGYFYFNIHFAILFDKIVFFNKKCDDKVRISKLNIASHQSLISIHRITMNQLLSPFMELLDLSNYIRYISNTIIQAQLHMIFKKSLISSSICFSVTQITNFHSRRLCVGHGRMITMNSTSLRNVGIQ